MPMPMSLLSFPFDSSRYIPYSHSTSIEKERKHSLPISILDAIKIDLIDMASFGESYLSPECSSFDSLHKDDQVLLLLGGPKLSLSVGEETKFDINLPLSNIGVSTSPTTKEHRRTNATWLRKHEPWKMKSISTNERESFTSQPMTVQKAISIIDKTFEDAQEATVLSSLSHPLHPHLSVSKVVPILPDTSSWPDNYGLFIFDSAPYKSHDIVAEGDGTLKSVRGFVRPLNLISDPSVKFFYLYAPSSKDPSPSSHTTKPDGHKNHDNINLGNQMSDTMKMPFIKDYDYQAGSVDCSNLFVVSIGESKALYHPIRNKLMLKGRRARKDSLPPPNGISISRRPFTEDENCKRLSRLLPIQPHLDHTQSFSEDV